MPPAATTSAQALSNLQSAASSQKTPDQVYQANSGALGIPQAQTQVSGLRGAINNTTNLLQQVAPSVMGRTQNSLVTSAQANAQIANGQAPLNTQLDSENQQYSGASSDLTNLLGQANTETSNDLTGQQNQLSYLQGIYGDLSAAEQQQFTNQQDAQKLLDAEKAAAAGTGGVGLAGSGTPTGPLTPGGAGTVGTMSRNAVNGYGFADASGKPQTMGAYLLANRYSGQALINEAAQLLAKSGSSHDIGIANAISNTVHPYTPAQLEQLYPQVFGGT